jgi:hypothetical protein
MAKADIRPPSSTEELYHAVGRIEAKLEDVAEDRKRITSLERRVNYGGGFFAACLMFLGFHVAR